MRVILSSNKTTTRNKEQSSSLPKLTFLFTFKTNFNPNCYNFFFSPGCPIRQNSLWDSCYEIFSDAKNRQDALTSCGPHGHLVDINTEYEQRDLAKLLRASDVVGDVWFGLRTNVDSAAGNVNQTWSDESSLTYEAWDPNGKNPSDASCIAMTELYNYRWGDSVDCNKQLGYVCEFNKGIKVPRQSC